MVDLPAFGLVLAGTLVATLLQCGWRDCAACLHTLFGLLGRGMNQDATRAALARQIEDIRRDGLLRAQPRATGDSEIDDATGAMFTRRSLDALLENHARYRQSRFAATDRARKVLDHASELSPIAGLAGTLLSLGQLAGPLGESHDIAATIGLAVSTTFYGLLIGNAIYLPLSGFVARQAAAEDAKREQLFIWLEDHIAEVEPRLRRGDAAFGHGLRDKTA